MMSAEADSDQPEGEPTRSVGGTPQGCPSLRQDLSTGQCVKR